MGKFTDKTGEVKYNNTGNKMEIIRYNGILDMDVKIYHDINGKLITYIRKNTQYANFENGNIKSPYDITIRSFGYIGEGKYTRSFKNDEGKIKLTKEFQTYEKMIMGCENDNSKIYSKWINFQTFSEWYNSNYYECDENLVLIRLSKTIASPDTCVLVPKSIYSRYIKTIDISSRKLSMNNNIEKFMEALKSKQVYIPIDVYHKIIQSIISLANIA